MGFLREELRKFRRPLDFLREEKRKPILERPLGRIRETGARIRERLEEPLVRGGVVEGGGVTKGEQLPREITRVAERPIVGTVRERIKEASLVRTPIRYAVASRIAEGKGLLGGRGLLEFRRVRETEETKEAKEGKEEEEQGAEEEVETKVDRRGMPMLTDAKKRAIVAEEGSRIM